MDDSKLSIQRARHGEAKPLDRPTTRLENSLRRTGHLLEETLGHSNKNLREAAIQGFADIGGDDAVRALGIALHDEDPTLREGAVDALGVIGGEAAVGLLRQVLADNDPAFRSAAADILEELSPPGAVTQ